MTRVPASRSREEFADSLDRVEKGERVLVESGGKAVAALVPLADLATLEEAEGVAAAMEARAGDEGTISLAELKARLGL